MAAARTFDSLHATIGNKALDDILPAMLDMLSDPDPAIADAALDGLKQVSARDRLEKPSRKQNMLGDI